MGIENLICIYKKKKEKSKNCVTCCGITNICGFYENKSGLNPFEDVYLGRRTVEEIKRINRRKQMYEDEKLGLWY